MTVKETELEDGKKAETEDGKKTEQENAEDGKKTELTPEEQKAKEEEDRKKAESEDEDKGNAKETAIGLIKKAESILKEGKELPKDLMWTLSHVDPDVLKSSEEKEEPEDRETWYEKKRDEEIYNLSIEDLEADYKEEEVVTIKEEIEDLVENHNMLRMKAFDLVTAKFGKSASQKLKDKRRRQVIPQRADVAEDTDHSDYEKTAKGYFQKTGRKLNKETFKKLKEQDLI